MSAAEKRTKTTTRGTFSRQMNVHTRTRARTRRPGAFPYTHTRKHTTHTHTLAERARAAPNVGHWALLSLGRADTVPEASSLRSDHSDNDAAALVRDRRPPAPLSARWEALTWSAGRRQPPRFAYSDVASSRRGPGGLRGWGEKQEAYFILRSTVMRNSDSRAHYFASTVAAEPRGSPSGLHRGNYCARTCGFTFVNMTENKRTRAANQ